MIKITVDSRETKLIETLKSRDVEYIQAGLNLGDILISDTQDVVYCLIERKTICDLLSSIRDGRYSEQKSRLKSNFNVKNILYIIEDYESFSQLNNKSLESALLNTIFRDDIKIMFSKNLYDTSDIILRLSQQIERFPSYFLSKNSTECKVFDNNILKKPKVSNINVAMLSNIDSISINIASEIIKKFKSLKQLIQKYNEERETSIDELQNLKINNRRVSKTAIKNLIAFLEG